MTPPQRRTASDASGDQVQPEAVDTAIAVGQVSRPSTSDEAVAVKKAAVRKKTTTTRAASRTTKTATVRKVTTTRKTVAKAAPADADVQSSDQPAPGQPVAQARAAKRVSKKQAASGTSMAGPSSAPPSATSTTGAKKAAAKKAGATQSAAGKASAKKVSAKKSATKATDASPDAATPAGKKAATKKAAAKSSSRKTSTRTGGPVNKVDQSRHESGVGELVATAGVKGSVEPVLATRPMPKRIPPAAVVSQAGKPPSSIDEFVTAVLGASPEFTAEQVAELAGVETDVARALWRAMGFADVGGAAVFSWADVEALRSLMSLVRAGYMSDDEGLEMVRAIGQHTSRLAEWQGNIIARSMIERGVMERQGVLEAEDIGALLRDSHAYQPVLESLMVYSWRRQMSHNATRAAEVAQAGSDTPTGFMTVGFADLAGFTRLSRQIPEEDLAILVKHFESVSADVVAAHGSRLIKTLGDEVLFVHESPARVASIAIELHDAHRRNSEIPRMRIGLSTGPVLLRMGDVYGTTVNRASRLTAMAKPGSTYVDAATLEALEDLPDFSFKSIRPRPARGFGLLRAWSLSRPKKPKSQAD